MIEKYNPQENHCQKCNSVFSDKDIKFVRNISHPINGVIKIKCPSCGYKWKRLPIDAK